MSLVFEIEPDVWQYECDECGSGSVVPVSFDQMEDPCPACGAVEE